MKYKSRILVVDDQSLMRDHIQRLLEREGYLLRFAESGHSALNIIETFSPDLVLLDVRLPDIDGYEVCRRIRATAATADLPIIMVTAFDDSDSRLKGLEAGADDFIPKPYDSIELRARVRTITRLNRYRRMVGERTKFQILAERSITGYLLVNGAGFCTFANRQARLYLGLPEQMDLPITSPFLTLVREQYQLESEKAWQNWPDKPGEDVVRYLVRPESADEPALWLLVETVDRLLSDDEMVWMVSVRDVTNQMSARHDMWKFQRAIHHKMRTPLIGMYTGIQFLHEFMDELPKEEVMELMGTALEHSNRLKNVVEDVLRYVDTPTLASGVTGFRLNELQEVVYAIGRGLEIPLIDWTGLDEVEGVVLALSRQSMELILMELLENAKKFHPQNAPMITIRLKKLADSRQVRLQVCDDGGKLTPEQLAQVWSPYYQAEKNFTGEVVGMGLGLPTVASIVWGVGGHCRIYNADGDYGVVAELILPMSQGGSARSAFLSDEDEGLDEIIQSFRSDSSTSSTSTMA